jgi:hypothetical protein
VHSSELTDPEFVVVGVDSGVLSVGAIEETGGLMGIGPFGGGKGPAVIRRTFIGQGVGLTLHSRPRPIGIYASTT